jgi:hypothetical protein
MRSLSFTLPFSTESLNKRDRKHWAVKRSDKTRLANEVMVGIGGPRYFPHPPFARARITVERCSAGRLDPDNLAASCKGLLDVLCVPTPTHPNGLGIIDDDTSDHIELILRQSPAPRGAGSTSVTVEELCGVVTHKPKRRTRSALASGA